MQDSLKLHKYRTCTCKFVRDASPCTIKRRLETGVVQWTFFLNWTFLHCYTLNLWGPDKSSQRKNFFTIPRNMWNFYTVIYSTYITKLEGPDKSSQHKKILYRSPECLEHLHTVIDSTYITKLRGPDKSPQGKHSWNACLNKGTF